MKVKELKKKLENCDDESEVIANGVGIRFVVELPGYYDGGCTIFNDNEIIFTKTRKKVVLNTPELDCWLMNRPKSKITFEGYNEEAQKRIIEKCKEHIKEGIFITKESRLYIFEKWAETKIDTFVHYYKLCRIFFEHFYNYEPEDKRISISFYDRCIEEWNRKFDLEIRDNELFLKESKNPKKR